MSGLEYEIENCYRRNQPEGAIPLEFAETVRVANDLTESGHTLKVASGPRAAVDDIAILFTDRLVA